MADAQVPAAAQAAAHLSSRLPQQKRAGEASPCIHLVADLHQAGRHKQCSKPGGLAGRECLASTPAHLRPNHGRHLNP